MKMDYNHTRTTDIKKSLAVVRKTMYVAGEMKRQDPTEVKDNLAMTAKQWIQTDVAMGKS